MIDFVSADRETKWGFGGVASFFQRFSQIGVWRGGLPASRSPMLPHVSGEVPAKRGIGHPVPAMPISQPHQASIRNRGALPSRLRCRMKIFDFHPAVFPSVRPTSLQACRRRAARHLPIHMGRPGYGNAKTASSPPNPSSKTESQHPGRPPRPGCAVLRQSSQLIRTAGTRPPGARGRVPP